VLLTQSAPPLEDAPYTDSSMVVPGVRVVVVVQLSLHVTPTLKAQLAALEVGAPTVS
jgi:hypothetical protein